ncbi:uncharacterized protein LOC108202046 [Daucus carota subsp. sativus]|uniref:DC1 domain-containing protein n=1 Tax=Daucus carota subsp. sativus TaxID=79200 RepID=A0A175YFI0_DAUCS|nr:PREDICTED: uncharacterized protein LOC108202046 [Daucus carota subsp. sativus]
MEQLSHIKHFSHEHPLILSKYNHSPPHANALCIACDDPISSNTDPFYHCIHQSFSSRNSHCTHFLLHKACAELPIIIQHPFDENHVLTLSLECDGFSWCESCDPCRKTVARWIYICREGGHDFKICIKCALILERELDHPSHSHPLTLLPVKATLQRCTACGVQGSTDYSYLCKTCLYWIHKRCATAPPSLIRDDHDYDHPLVLAYSLPEEYWVFGVSCYLCSVEIRWLYWVYYCADCRYFAHVHCALSQESRKDGNEIDDNGDLVHLPICDDEPYLFYQLIQQFANKFSTEESGKADTISECRSGHSLILFDNSNDKSVNVETNICDGCVQPLLYPFYGCLDCNFFLHTLCAAELPREIERPSHTDDRLTRLTTSYETSKPFNFYVCGVCDRFCNGVVYYDELNEYWVDVLCVSLPRKIKHDCHKHTLRHLSVSPSFKRCRACEVDIFSHSFACKICDYYIHIKCALKRGTIKHRWDEHHLSLVYPPVKGHPHDFNCELCSIDINPNYWFYHCAKCDTSFHALCVDQDVYSNIKFGGDVKDVNLHQHTVQLHISRRNSKCAECGLNTPDYFEFFINSPYYYVRKPFIQCTSCEFLVCIKCIFNHYGYPHLPQASRIRRVDSDLYEEIF